MNLLTYEAVEWDEVFAYGLGQLFDVNGKLCGCGKITDYENNSSSKCFLYDFNTNTTEELSIGNGEEYETIYMSYDGDDLHFVSFFDERDYQLWHYNANDENFIQSDISQFQRNSGISRWVKNPVFTQDDRLFFNSNSSLYLTNNDETHELLDDMFSLDILTKNALPHVVVLLSDSLFSVSVNASNQVEYSFISEETVENLNRNMATSNVHFFSGNRHYNVDLDIIDSIPLPAHNGEVDIVNVSGDVALVSLVENFEYSFFLFDTKSRVLRDIPYLLSNRVHTFPIHDTQFLIAGFAAFGNGSAVYLIDSLGNKKHEKVLNYSLPNNRLNVTEGDEVTSIALQSVDSTLFYMIKDNQLKIRRVRNIGIDYQKEDLIFTDNNEIVLQTFEDGSKYLQYVSFDNEPQVFEELGDDVILVKAYVTQNDVLVLLSNRSTGFLTLRKYSKSTFSMEDTIDLESDISQIVVGESFYRLSDTSVILVINDTYHGNELYN